MEPEKTIQFIQKMQAKHEVTIQQLGERMNQTEGMLRQLVDVSMSLARHGEETDRRIGELTTSIKELRDTQANTEYKLNALIDTVDKLAHHNGH